MRSLHIDTRPDWRGGQNQVLLTLRGLRARGVLAELVALAGSPLAKRADEEGFRVHTVRRSCARLDSTRLLLRLLDRTRYDIVHAHDPHGLTAAWLAGAHRRAAVVAQRRVANPLSRSHLGLARYRAARRILAVSRFVAASVVASGIPSSHVDVNYEGVDVPPPAAPEERQHGRRRWGVDGAEILLGCVGYLLPEKGQETLVRMLPALIGRVPNCRLLLAGDGPSRPALEKLARRLGLARRVVFAGFVQEIAEVYRALDVFLFPSLAEPLGTSLLGAMAYGLPAIAVASGGVPEIIESGRNGVLVSASEGGLFAAALLELLANPAEARRMQVAACQTIVAKFSTDRMVEGTLETYRRILVESPP